MPFNRLVLLLIIVITAAAATIYVALSLMGALQLPPLLGLGILSILALCASFAVRRWSRLDRNTES